MREGECAVVPVRHDELRGTFAALARKYCSCTAHAYRRHALLPMDMLVADMIPDNPGTWLFHCHTGPHLRAGMQAKYVVLDAPETRASATPEGKN